MKEISALDKLVGRACFDEKDLRTLIFTYLEKPCKLADEVDKNKMLKSRHLSRISPSHIYDVVNKALNSGLDAIGLCGCEVWDYSTTVKFPLAKSVFTKYRFLLIKNGKPMKTPIFMA